MVTLRTALLAAGTAGLLGFGAAFAQGPAPVSYEFGFSLERGDLVNADARAATRDRLADEAETYCERLTAEHGMPDQVHACTDAVMASVEAELSTQARAALYASAE
ncbi:UrcA family protein [Parvularcula dongshanensis]|uniref:UrcA family protein n=1 Tax=Parvularcula dongshanensis TaxID=1173995 RepID=A0A840I3K2_9PROT|nr:UrcA family protein [Parvularcula dongshanensis]MBB4658620.1 UrcA family protein [Parvularcula dongshanensis]